MKLSFVAYFTHCNFVTYYRFQSALGDELLSKRSNSEICILHLEIFSFRIFLLVRSFFSKKVITLNITIILKVTIVLICIDVYVSPYVFIYYTKLNIATNSILSVMSIK